MPIATVPARPAVVEAEEVKPLASLLQMHDPRLGLLELEAHRPRALNRLETVGDIALQNPPPALPGLIDQHLERIVRRLARAKPERARQEVLP